MWQQAMCQAVGKYLAAIAVQMLAISAFFAALDAVLTSSEFQPPEAYSEGNRVGPSQGGPGNPL